MRRFKLLFLIIILFLFFLFVFVFIKISTLDKFIFVNRGKTDNVEIIIYDPNKDITKKIIIPSDTVLKSSHDLGEYKVSSLWILGEKEGYNGSLVANSIAKNYLIPVYLWKNNQSSNMDIFKLIKSKIILKLSKISEITISNSKLSNSELINFVNSDMDNNNIQIAIEDLTDSVGLAEDVTNILQIMGIKNILYTRGTDENLDCEVIGNNKNMLTALANNFECKTILDENAQNIRLRLGHKFASRF